eukprot:scaffold699714_cov114-Attheya_sp.AAC.1
MAAALSTNLSSLPPDNTSCNHCRVVYPLNHAWIVASHNALDHGSTVVIHAKAISCPPPTET